MRVQLPEHGLRAGRERRRQVGHVRLVEHAERRVQVVVGRVDQLQRDHRTLEDLLGLGVRRVGRAEPGAGQQHVPGQQDVALALVGVLGHGHAEAPLAEPGRVRRGLVGPLGVPELHAQHPALDHGRAVGREDHVGQAGQRLDQLDRVAQVEVGLPEHFPLVDGERVVVRRRGIHPRIDPVRDREMGGPAHQIPARRGGDLHDPNAMRAGPADTLAQRCAPRTIVA